MSDQLMIPDFTYAQYTESDEPYEWLYSHKDNKFLMKQLTQRMKQKAGSLGVKYFISLFNAYCETVTQKQGIKLDNSTQFDGQPMELFSGDYICDEYGVAQLDKFGYENIICRHPIMPTRRLINIDSGEERLEIAYKKGKTWRTIIAEKSMIASSSQILQLAAFGIMVNSENAKALSTYLLSMEELNYDTIPEQKSVGRLGWVISNGFSPYVNDLVFDGETNFKHIFNSVKSNGSKQKWIDAMKKVRAEKGAGRLFLAASFSSVILEPCGLLPYFFHAWGGTETGKTVGLMIAASVWACPKMGEYITTFNSTIVGQEMTASFLNSLPMCVDELQIQSSAGIKDFDRIIYQLTEGVGRTRGAKLGGLQKQNTWKNCIITNGEHPISNANSGGGAVNRIIEFECAEKVYSDLVGLCAIINDNYGFAGHDFIEYLQSEGSCDRVNEIQKEFYRELLKSDSTDKQAASASAILAADAIATELIFKDGNALTPADMASIMTKKQEVNVNTRTLEYIYELVGRNPLRFRPDEYGDYKGEVWGKIDMDYIYIVKSVFDRELLSAGFNSVSFLAWAKRNNIISCDKDNRRTKKAKIGDSLLNTVCLVRNADKTWENEAELADLLDELPL
jgi:uncharacterized protein (DUF927 family)